MKKYFFNYTKNSKQYARENRRSGNPYEMSIWKHVLNNKAIMKYKWTRQKPIENYILDFYCAKLRLGIEIDGRSHEDNHLYDLLRTNLLDEYNIKIIRYSNNDVRFNLDYIYFDLIEKINERERELEGK